MGKNQKAPTKSLKEKRAAKTATDADTPTAPHTSTTARHVAATGDPTARTAGRRSPPGGFLLCEQFANNRSDWRVVDYSRAHTNEQLSPAATA